MEMNMQVKRTIKMGGLVMAFWACGAHMEAQATPTLTTLYSFQGAPDGADPYGSVVIGSGGVLYGTTSLGGNSAACRAGCGTVFSLTPPASAGGVWSEAVLLDFMGGNGVTPPGNVAIGAGGVLYGVTLGALGRGCQGAACGTVFSLTPPASPGGAWTQTELHKFAGAPADGQNPYAGVVIDSNGVLYGTTATGGNANAGTVYSLTPPASPGGAWTEEVLYSFFSQRGDGTGPYASLVIGQAGVLYGTTAYNSTSNSAGTVFSLTPPPSPGGAWTERVLHAFTGGSDGAIPHAGLVIGNGGVLYGATEGGGTGSNGTVFSLTPPASPGGAWTESVLYSFAGGADGSEPHAAVTITAGGTLAGTTAYGGTGACTIAFSGCGTVFSLTPPASAGGAWTEMVLHTFVGSDGAFPEGNLVIGSGEMVTIVQHEQRRRGRSGSPGG
jgi:uncharacterized repeat protein (TIGR03803 family)